MTQRRDERGQVLVLVVLAVIVIFAFAGLAFDIGRFYAEKRFLQNAADAAALAAANALIRGETDASARQEALDILARNFIGGPNGVVPTLPPDTPVYENGHAGDPSYLANGILISGGGVRVAVQSTVSYTFGRALGFTDNTIGGRARTQLTGNVLPIAVRQFVNTPGPTAGASNPCPENPAQFMDFFATALTSCLGTDTDASLRSSPNAGNPFDAVTPGSDPTNHGPVVTILGQGAQPSNGADFRGFIALDIRNFQTDTSQLYYNGVTASTNANTLKTMEAGWVTAGGYPGPMFPPATAPPDPNDQVAVMAGNSTGIVIDAVATRFGPGDEVLVAVYPGITMAIPDFTIGSPGTVSLLATGTTGSAGSFRVSRNQAFSGTATLSTVTDALDPQNPMNTGALAGGASPITYSPNPVTPSLGAGQQVDMQNVTTSGATEGVYALWIQGEAGSPYLTTKLEPFAVKIGSVSRDFTMTASSSEQTAANVGDPVTFTLNLKRSGPAFGGTVDLSMDTPLPAGVGAITFSPSSVTPESGNGTDVTLTINTGTMAPGSYRLVVRASGMNGDSTPHKITHLLALEVNVATAAAGGNQEYVDIVGFAVMRIAAADSNHVDAYAITPVIGDMSDSQLRRGQAARLVPWN